MSRLASHYETVRERFGYDRVDAGSAPPWLQPLRRRFVAADGAAVLESALDRPTLVTMGVGMTGPPHLGTVGQLLTAIELQHAGLDVQFVLADLEPYHGGADPERVARLAQRYREFALDLGFDPERGVLRTQSEATAVLATGHRLARYYRPEEWAEIETADTEWTSEVEALYERRRSDGEASGDASAGGATSEAADAHSAVLHGADFLHWLREDDYDQLLLVFGIDEHGLVPWTRQFRDAAGISGRVAGCYTRMLPGVDGVLARQSRARARRTEFDGVPKQSKSIDAGTSLAAEPSAIRERIASASGANDPAASTVFQATCLASRYDADRLDSLEAACAAGDEEWADARSEYAEYVVGLAERWHATRS